MRDHTHLWNDLSEDERKRLMPYMIETHILHIEQAKARAIVGHNRTIAEFDAHIASLKEILRQHLAMAAN